MMILDTHAIPKIPHQLSDWCSKIFNNVLAFTDINELEHEHEQAMDASHPKAVKHLE